MKPTFFILIVLITFVSCSKEPTILSTNYFVNAVEAIATSSDVDVVQPAVTALHNGGLDAIASLRQYLNDKRVPPSNCLQRDVSGTQTMSDHAFWLIQDMIETPTPKQFTGEYSILTPANVESWLDERDGRSLVQLQFDAAKASYNKAKKDKDTNGTFYADDAIKLYRDRLEQLEK